MATTIKAASTESAGRTGRQRAALPVLVSVAALVAIVSSLGAPLIPSIARSDRVSLSTAQWLLTAALMTGALATPAMGRLADGPRKRRVVEVALAVVLAGCVLSAVATNFWIVVIGRGLQGFGLGLLPVTMAIARSQFSPAKASRAIATLSVSAAVGAGLGYPITALIAQLFDFHAAFWFGAITVSVALVLVVVVLPEKSDGRSRRFDFVGMATLGVAVVGVSVLLSEGGEWGWTSLPSLGLVVVCIVVVGLWIDHELKISDPLIDVRQVRNRSVLTADVSAFFIAAAMYLFLPIIVEFVQIPVASGYGFGASVVVSGLVFVPLSVGSFAASRCLVAYARRFRYPEHDPLRFADLRPVHHFLRLGAPGSVGSLRRRRNRRSRHRFHLRGHARVHRAGRSDIGNGKRHGLLSGGAQYRSVCRERSGGSRAHRLYAARTHLSCLRRIPGHVDRRYRPVPDDRCAQLSAARSFSRSRCRRPTKGSRRGWNKRRRSKGSA